MKKFLVRKGHDAYVYYTTVVEAESAEEANKIAGSYRYNGEWEKEGDDEFDHYDIFDDETEEVDE